MAKPDDGGRGEKDAQAQQDAERGAASLNQAQADSNQVGSDSDQLASQEDQALADRDQHASDRDQAAADWEIAHSSESTAGAEAHEAARVERNEASRERDSTAEARAKTTARRLATATRRDDVAGARDRTAESRDHAAKARDEGAAAHDRAAEVQEQRVLDAGGGDEAVAALRAVRTSSASIRQQAQLDRVAAAADRVAGAADRQAAAADRQFAGVDELTGVYRRGTGEMTLTHEIERSRRTARSLILAVIDVDSLKVVNDTQGHAAGDALLRDAAAAITSTLRSYDVTVRWGGDEFICALSDVTLAVAPRRVAAIQHALDARRPGATLSAGFAELQADDTLESLMARADSALYRARADADV
jgi:diguanylate cyclase (GGDEF)-like protein